MIGQTLSHYRITEKIGAGGMGEVYQAEDLRLRRQVAIKVLPDIFAADPERLARFEREAKLLASLNHQNIAVIYGLEEAKGKRFLAMELVEGETLAQRIKKGPLPVDEALEVCCQIAEGLEAAHEKSIIHRDLKPSNLKITPEGKVKILDFGLARAFLDQSPAAVIADSPTITAEMTRPGVILGTAAYMSPEQAKGNPVDKRADIWAFGCILFECLTGRPAFPGETITEVLASILKGEPEWDALPRNLPTNVRTALRRCLEKDRHLRYHDIADVRIEIAEDSIPASNDKEVAHQRPVRSWIMGAVVGGLVFGTVAVFITWLLRPVAPPPSVSRSVLKIEPGRWLAYVSDESGRMEVWVRPFPGPGGKWQVSKEGGREPIWSKDGKQLFYREADRVWVADVRTNGGFSAGKPRLLFEKAGFFLTNAVRNWDLYSDGRGFLMVKKEEIKPRPVMEMILVMNWFEELKRQVPSGK